MSRTNLKWSDLKPRLLSALRPGEWIPAVDLIPAVYPGDEPEYVASMIWKLVDSLRKDGLNIEGRQNVGYRLID